MPSTRSRKAARRAAERNDRICACVELAYSLGFGPGAVAHTRQQRTCRGFALHDEPFSRLDAEEDDRFAAPFYLWTSPAMVRRLVRASTAGLGGSGASVGVGVHVRRRV